MSYKICSTPDSSDIVGSMGCLDDIAYLINEYDLSGFYIDLYSRNDNRFDQTQILPRIYSFHPLFETLFLPTFKTAVREIVAELPDGLFQEAELDTILETGLLPMNAGMDAAEAHTRLAPFRLFLERRQSLVFYETYKHESILGAWIGSHFHAPDRMPSMKKQKLIFLDVEGWHQSMFPDVRGASLGSIYLTGSQGYNNRRVLALHEEFRHLFSFDGSLQYGEYRIPALNSTVGENSVKFLSKSRELQKLVEQQRKCVPNSPEYDTICVHYLAQWYHTVVEFGRTCKEKAKSVPRKSLPPVPITGQHSDAVVPIVPAEVYSAPSLSLEVNRVLRELDTMARLSS